MTGAKLRSHVWSDLTRAEIADAVRQDALVVLPIGSIEQHADHLPVGTDSMTAGDLSLRAARVADHPVLVLPTIAAAFSPHHASFAGTLTLRLATFNALIEDVTASVARAGFRRQLIVNGHGGNRGPLMALTAELITGGREVGYLDYWAPCLEDFGKTVVGAWPRVGHACEIETSLIMALRQNDPSVVDFIRARSANLPHRLEFPYVAAGAPDPISDAGASWPAIFGGGDCGYHGDPARASLATGDKLIEIVTARLSAFFTAFAKAELRAGTDPIQTG